MRLAAFCASFVLVVVLDFSGIFEDENEGRRTGNGGAEIFRQALWNTNSLVKKKGAGGCSAGADERRTVQKATRRPRRNNP